jgi:ketosteroid isomerase-like protein
MIGGDIASCFTLVRTTGVKSGGHKVDMWFRATSLFKRVKSEWKICHMHNSVPFAMDGSEHALLTLKPE